MVCGTIIFDKSAIQSFSKRELSILHFYYQYVLTPVLVLEFAGDLAKKPAEGKDALQEVTLLANKINPTGTAMNRRYEEIVITEMIDGVDIPDYRPVPRGRFELDGNKQRNFFVEQTEEERMIEEWKSGKFDPAVIEAAESYRKYFVSNPTEERKKYLEEKIDYQSLSGLSLEQIRDKMKYIHRANEYNWEIINSVLDNCGIHKDYRTRIWDRWMNTGMPNLESMSKYAFYCAIVENTFDAALVLDIIGPRSTNIIDLQYLFYLPFTRIFVSGDKLHDLMAPVFIDSYQVYLRAEDLKRDLHRIDEYLSSLTEEERKQYRQYPPELSGSITHELALTNILPEDIRLKRLSSEDNTEGIVVEKMISIYSECACGSGKMGKDCHAPCFCGSRKRMVDCHPR